MFAQKVTVNYVDGTESEVVLSQWSIGAFAQYANKQGWTVDPQSPGLMGIVMLRYQAYAELHRDPSKPRAAFEKWDMTVMEVSPLEEPKAVTPTKRAASVA